MYRYWRSDRRSHAFETLHHFFEMRFLDGELMEHGELYRANMYSNWRLLIDRFALAKTAAVARFTQSETIERVIHRPATCFWLWIINSTFCSDQIWTSRQGIKLPNTPTSTKIFSTDLTRIPSPFVPCPPLPNSTLSTSTNTSPSSTSPSADSVFYPSVTVQPLSSSRMVDSSSL